jgi:hypothetical protein
LKFSVSEASGASGQKVTANKRFKNVAILRPGAKWIDKNRELNFDIESGLIEATTKVNSLITLRKSG